MPDNLKKGWTRVAFGDVVERVEESGVPTSEESRTYIGLEHLDSDSFTVTRWGSNVDLVVSKTRIKKGDVLFARRNTHLKRCALAPFDAYFSPDGYAFRSNSSGLLQDLLLYIVASDRFMGFAIEHSAGTHSKRVKWEDLARYEFGLPPLDEQNRIVKALRAIEILKVRIDEILHRGKILCDAFAEEQFGTTTRAQVRLSEHYSITSGQVDPREPEYASLPLVAPNHIECRSGRILRIESAEAQSAISGKYLFEEGSVLYSKIRPNLVKASIAPCRGLCSADMYVLIPKPSLHKEYLLGIMLSDRFTRFAVSGSMRTGIPKLNREHLVQYECHIPDMKTQEEYVAVIRSINMAIKSALQYEEALTCIRKSILEGFVYAI